MKFAVGQRTCAAHSHCSGWDYPVLANHSMSCMGRGAAHAYTGETGGSARRGSGSRGGRSLYSDDYTSEQQQVMQQRLQAMQHGGGVRRRAAGLNALNKNLTANVSPAQHEEGDSHTGSGFVAFYGHGETPEAVYERRVREGESNEVNVARYLMKDRFSMSDLRPDETAEQALERRMRESAEVEERVVYIDSKADLQQKLKQAGNKLVVLEVMSEQVCQTGLSEEAEVQWKQDPEKVYAPCVNIKHTFQRTARESEDVVFLAIEADSDRGQAICDSLDITVLPTLRFYKDGRQLWQIQGSIQAESNLGEGVLYYGDTAANGVKGSDFVAMIHSRESLTKFINNPNDKELTVVFFSLTSATPCVKVFPAVLALARSFGGFACFARVLGDENPELAETMREYKVLEVPTFVFFRGGKEVGRHVGSSRGDLIGQILQQQSLMGIAPPPPPPKPVVAKPKVKAPPKRKNRW